MRSSRFLQLGTMALALAGPGSGSVGAHRRAAGQHTHHRQPVRTCRCAADRRWVRRHLGERRCRRRRVRSPLPALHQCRRRRRQRSRRQRCHRLHATLPRSARTAMATSGSPGRPRSCRTTSASPPGRSPRTARRRPFSSGSTSPRPASSTTPTSPSRPMAASSSSGQDDGQQAAQDIFLRTFDANGDPLSAEIAVNQSEGFFRARPAVAMDVLGNLVVAWEAEASSGKLHNIFMLVSSTPTACRSPANSGSMRRWPGRKRRRDVARQGTGEFLAVWESFGQDGDQTGVYGSDFTALGAASGPEFRVNLGTAESQLEPSVGLAADGTAVVAFRDVARGVLGRAFAAERIHFRRRFPDQRAVATRPWPPLDRGRGRRRFRGGLGERWPRR